MLNTKEDAFAGSAESMIAQSSEFAPLGSESLLKTPAEALTVSVPPGSRVYSSALVDGAWFASPGTFTAPGVRMPPAGKLALRLAATLV